jgi:hypothetical protein
MSELEFDVLDELYFVTPFDELQHQTGLSAMELIECLHSLLQKKYIKILTGPDDEVEYEADKLHQHPQKYFFLATKLGLMAHNGR